MSVRTEQAGGGRVLLDGLGHVVLYPLPDLPLEARMQDVERLQRMEPPVPLVLGEDGLVCPVVPLQEDTQLLQLHSVQQETNTVMSTCQAFMWFCPLFKCNVMVLWCYVVKMTNICRFGEYLNRV